MSIDIFGRTSNKTSGKQYSKGIPGAPGIGFKLTSDGQFDLEGKRLCNVTEPIAGNDVVTLLSMRSLVKQEVGNILKLISNINTTILQCSTKVKTLQESTNQISKLENRVAELGNNIATLQIFFDEQLKINEQIDKKHESLSERLMQDWYSIVEIKGRLSQLDNSK